MLTHFDTTYRMLDAAEVYSPTLEVATVLLSVATMLLSVATILLSMATMLLSMATMLLSMATVLLSMATVLLSMATVLLSMATVLLSMATVLLSMANSCSANNMRPHVSLKVCSAWLWREVRVNAYRQCDTCCINVQHLRVLTRFSRGFHDAIIAVVKHPTVTHKVNKLFATDV